MANILFVTPYYPPEKAAPAIRISESASLLVQRGHAVTVLTTMPNYPTGVVPPEYKGHALLEEQQRGVHVVRSWSYTSPNRGFLRRILSQLSFGCLAPMLGGRAVGYPDVIIVESPPLFDAIAGRIMSWVKRCPFIFIVSDLWPASAIQLGMLRNPLLIRLAEWLEWSTYQRAGLIWTVTADIRKQLIRRGLSPDKVFLLTNGVDINKFYPMSREQARAELGWDQQFTALYAGTHGLAHGLTTLLDAAKRLKDRQEAIRFVLVGDGAAKQDLIAYAHKHDLTNVQFLDPQDHEQMPTLLAAADACLVPLRKLPLFEGALPSKMYEAMACARPIVLGVEGEAKQLIEREAGSALAVEPENVDELVEALLYLAKHPAEAAVMGQRGRLFVEKYFDRELLVSKLEVQIEKLLGRARTSQQAIETPLALQSSQTREAVEGEA
ncbi:MAG TPA: glycosyltransferase family 4 protein [Ktedonobacteraceae bacterium]